MAQMVMEQIGAFHSEAKLPMNSTAKTAILMVVVAVVAASAGWYFSAASYEQAQHEADTAPRQAQQPVIDKQEIIVAPAAPAPELDTFSVDESKTHIVARGDFNGDGLMDLAAGFPASDEQSGQDAFVQIVYGSRENNIIKDVIRAPGSNNEHSGFGQSLASGDINGDGITDLVIGIPGHSDGVKNAGAAQVFYGAASGIDPEGSQLVHQDTVGFAGERREGDRFGFSVAIGDFDKDGYADLAIGIPFESVMDKTMESVGAVQIIYGSQHGLTTRDLLIGMYDDGILGMIQEDAFFGHALAVGDFNADGYADLAVGAPGYNVSGQRAAGSVTILPGSPKGISDQDVFITQDAPGYQDQADEMDQFGHLLATGDYNNDGYSDLVVGVEDGPNGSLQVLYGSELGITNMNNQIFSRVDKSIKSGFSAMSTDINQDGYEDLLIDASYRNTTGVQFDTSKAALLMGQAKGLQES